MGDEITIGSGSHRPTVEQVTCVARSGSDHVLLSAIKVPDPARLGTEIEEQQDLGFREALLCGLGPPERSSYRERVAVDRRLSGSGSLVL